MKKLNKRLMADCITAALRGSVQPAGDGDNSRQPVNVELPCSGQEAGMLPRPDGDVSQRASGHPSEDDGQPIGGALAGEHDYLDAHDLIDWDEAPFAATAWAIGRPHATDENPDPAPIARWLWVGADGQVDSTLAPDYGVKVNAGRGMTLRRPDIDQRTIIAPSRQIIGA